MQQFEIPHQLGWDRTQQWDYVVHTSDQASHSKILYKNQVMKCCGKDSETIYEFVLV